MNKSFQEQLREYDKALAKTPLRPATEQRIRKLLRSQAAPRRAAPRRVVARWCIAAAVLGCSVVLGVLVYSPQNGAERLIAGPNCQVSTGQLTATQYLGQCELQLPHMLITTEPGARLTEQAGKVTVLHGVARFDVAAVIPPAPPVEVTVAGGVIRVLGTNFTVRQTEQGGLLLLTSGHIAFLAAGKASVRLNPGDQLTWSETQVAQATAESAAAAPTPIESAAPAATPLQPVEKLRPSGELPSSTIASQAAASQALVPRPAATARSAAAAAATPGIAEVIELRAQGHYSRALTLLAQLESQRLDARTREVLSFEKGKLWERLSSTTQVCKHWRAHQTRYPDGRYFQNVVQQLKQYCALETSPSVAGE
jgi:hypothetical protein